MHRRSSLELYGGSETVSFKRGPKPQACYLDARLDKKRERQIVDLYKLRRKSVAARLVGVVRAPDVSGL